MRPKNIKVKVTSPSLRHLEMFLCDELTTMELSAPKLATFSFGGAKTEFLIGNNPCLTNLSLKEGHNKQMMDVIVAVSKHVPQLETLRMPRFFLDKYHLEEIPRLSQLRNLKHLEWEVFGWDARTIILLTTFIAAAPLLNTFKLKSTWPNFGERQILYPRRQIHRSLKVVKFLGFIGCLSDLAIATHLLNIAVNLEKIEIDPHRPFPNEGFYMGGIDIEPETSRKRAYEGLKGHLRPATRLLLL